MHVNHDYSGNYIKNFSLAPVSADEKKERRIGHSKCCPEIIICSEKMRHSLLCEWKDGANTRQEQLEMYGAVNSKFLLESALVRRAASENFDVAIFGRPEHADRLKIALTGQFAFPLVIVSDTRMEVVQNAFKADHLNNVLKNFEFDFNAAPVSFVPVDSQSSDVDIAKHAIPKIIEIMSERAPRIHSDDLCPRICNVWGVMESKGREGMRTCVCRVMHQAAAGEFQKYLKYGGKDQRCYVDVIDNPLTYNTDKRSAPYKRLIKLQVQFIERLQKGRLYDQQGEMFAE